MKKFSWKNTVTAITKTKKFEKFANECKNEGIILSDIKFQDEYCTFSMDFNDYKKILPVAFRSGVRTKISARKGAGYFAYKHRRRYGFFFGASLFAVLFCCLTSCIWVVDVIGNKETSTDEILGVMKKNGISIGNFKYGKNISKIKNSALIELDTLSWLWVTIDGTRAVVEVRERGKSPEVVDRSGVYNLVAAYPGVIVDTQIKYGRKLVERGMVVDKGQILAGGVSSSQYRENRFVHAAGKVIARTWREAAGEYHHNEKIKLKTGKTKKKYSLLIFDANIKLSFKDKPDFKNYVKKQKKTQLRVFKDIYLPFAFTTDTFYEIIIKDNVLEDEEVVSQAVDALTKQIESERSLGAETVQRTYSYETLPNGNLLVSVMLESNENIAKTVKVDIETTKEDVSGEDN